MEGQAQTQVHNGYSYKLGELLANTKNTINYYGETYVLHNEKINVTFIWYMTTLPFNLLHVFFNFYLVFFIEIGFYC